MIASDRVERLRDRLVACTLCPRQGGVDRLDGMTGYCRVPAELRVVSSGPHFGEERPLVGSGGSGTIFLGGCNLLCAFCQNPAISHGAGGEEVTPGELAETMLGLERRGCRNISFVTPTHYAAGLAEAIVTARDRGLSVPVVWNSGGYEEVDVLEELEGLVQIYMPDVKWTRSEDAEAYAAAPDYWEVCRRALREMQRQVGPLRIEDGVAREGLLVRHLVMPGAVDQAREVCDVVAAEIHPQTYVNLMAQYRPCCHADRFPAIARPLDRAEHAAAVAYARKKGLRVDEG